MIQPPTSEVANNAVITINSHQSLLLQKNEQVTLNHYNIPKAITHHPNTIIETWLAIYNTLNSREALEL